VVNNQLSPNYPNKNLSGAGIVYKFCQALDNYINVKFADYFLDLVAVGNASDSMDLREL
jgi:single-stranded-DNA-specific exonuclease